MIKTKIKTSTNPKCGRGLFAEQDIRKNQVISSFYGRRIKHAHRLSDKSFGWLVDMGDGTMINCHGFESKAKYANDANGLIKIGTRNNSRISIEKGKALLVASRNIKKGEEIYVSYGKSYWNAIKNSL